MLGTVGNTECTLAADGCTAPIASPKTFAETRKKETNKERKNGINSNEPTYFGFETTTTAHDHRDRDMDR
jgi:hypothetical protein